MKILVAGGSGLIGRAAIASFKAEGHEVTRLVRRPAEASDELSWDPSAGLVPLNECRKADAVVNMCGADLAAARWTKARLTKLRTSRIDATQSLAKIFTGPGASPSNRPGVFVSASAIGIYGDRGNLELNEASVPGNGFLAELCRDWEAAALAAGASGARVVCTRFGMVLSRDGGFLHRVVPFFRAGLGCALGSGRQWNSWIEIEDAVGALCLALFESAMDGPVNLVSPASVTNAGLTRALGRIFGRQLPMPVPPVVLRMIYGQMADEVLLASAHVVPAKLIRAAYPFRYPNLEDALYQALALEKSEE